MTTTYIIAIRSRSQVMRCYNHLRACGLSVRIINTPREVSIGCGISVEVSATDFFEAKANFVQDDYDSFIGLFRCERVGRCLTVIRV